MTAYERAAAKIAEQQKGNQQYSVIYQLGEQLKEICMDARCAQLVAEDLENKSMSLKELEKKIAAFASAHKSGNCGCCPPGEADRIIREFYGLPERAERVLQTTATEAEIKPKPRRSSLLDLLDEEDD